MEINPAKLTNQTQQSQNLVSPIRISFPARQPGFWKSIALDFISVCAALFFGGSYFYYLTVGISPWFVFGGSLLFAACAVLQVFLAQKIVRRVLVMLGETIALIVCFVFYDDWRVVLVAGAVTLVVLMWGYFTSRAELQNEMEIRFFKVTRGVLGHVTTAVLLFMILVYAPQAEGSGIFVPRESFRTLFSWTANFFENLYPGVTFNDSFANFSGEFAKAELRDNPTFLSLSQPEQNAAIEQAVSQLSGSVEKTTGVAPAPTESVSDVAYNFIVATLTHWKNQFQGQFTIIWVIVLFLIFRTIGFVFIWIAQFVSLIIYELLLALGFMRIDKVTQTKEMTAY